jgi:hypothetical protein
MSFYQHHVLPRLVHLAMRKEAMLPFRRCIIGAAEGQVLEIGIGSGLNLPRYGLKVRAVIGLEPSPELLLMARVHCPLGRLADVGRDEGRRCRRPSRPINPCSGQVEW